jgi:hypothetical protein
MEAFKEMISKWIGGEDDCEGRVEIMLELIVDLLNGDQMISDVKDEINEYLSQ